LIGDEVKLALEGADRERRREDRLAIGDGVASLAEAEA
jgi:hypothetical protein